ncbi:hypothetical protein Lesp01_81720 [Lentzea sp. NBRC 102530]|nr:hypothetical protein Lesp01_81720 [Lentzea sp. NBRC 102530]
MVEERVPVVTEDESQTENRIVRVLKGSPRHLLGIEFDVLNGVVGRGHRDEVAVFDEGDTLVVQPQVAGSHLDHTRRPVAVQLAGELPHLVEKLLQILDIRTDHTQRHRTVAGVLLEMGRARHDPRELGAGNQAVVVCEPSLSHGHEHVEGRGRQTVFRQGLVQLVPHPGLAVVS